MGPSSPHGTAISPQDPQIPFGALYGILYERIDVQSFIYGKGGWGGKPFGVFLGGGYGVFFWGGGHWTGVSLAPPAES